MIRKSILAQKALDETREAALTNGNDIQIKMLKIKLLGSLMEDDD